MVAVGRRSSLNASEIYAARCLNDSTHFHLFPLFSLLLFPGYNLVCPPASELPTPKPKCLAN